MKLLFLLLLSWSTTSLAFINPTRISCKNTEEVRLLSEGSVKTFYKKDFNEPLKKAAVVEVSKGRKVIAKLYPQNGIDHVILDKSFRVKTDEKSYWTLVGENNVVTCELLDE